MERMLKILEKVNAPNQGTMTPEVARAITELGFSPSDQARYQELAGRHNNGELAGEELEELRAFVEAETMLSMLQLKARASLTRSQPAA